MLFACIWLLFAIPVEVTARNDIQQNTDRVQAYTIDGKWVKYPVSEGRPQIPEKDKTKIVEIVFPNNVQEISGCYFQDCKNLQMVTLSSGMEEIPWNAFTNCVNLKEVKIPEGIQVICMDAFDGCKSLKSVCLPKGLKYVYDNAFGDCEQLKDVTILDSYTSISKNAFANTPIMSEMWEQAEGEYLIWNHILFGTKTPLVDVVIPEGVTSIAGSAFESDGTIRSVIIPSSMKFIGSAAFWNTGLETVVINGVEEIGANAFNETDIREITLPVGVKKIGNSAFLDCEKLTKVILLSGVEEIGEYAFFATGIGQITFPASVNKIGREAVAECKNLKKVVIRNPKVQLTGLDKGDYYGQCTILGMSTKRDWEMTPYYDKETTRIITVYGYRYSTAQELVERLKWTPRFYGCKSIRFKAIDSKTKNTTLESVKVPKTLTITEGKSKTIQVQLPKSIKKVTKFTKKKGQVKITYKVLDCSLLKVDKKGRVKVLSQDSEVPEGFATNRIYTTVTLPDGSRKVFTTKINVKPKKE